MLSPRTAALSAWREVRALGTAPVMGLEVGEVAAGRLAVARRAEAMILRARSAPREVMSEPCDDQLAVMLREVVSRVRLYERGAAGYEVRGGPASDAY